MKLERKRRLQVAKSMAIATVNLIFPFFFLAHEKHEEIGLQSCALHNNNIGACLEGTSQKPRCFKSELRYAPAPKQVSNAGIETLLSFLMN